MPDFGVGEIPIVPDLKGFGRNLSKGIGRDIDVAGKSAGGRFGSAFKGALAVGGVLAIGSVITKQIGAVFEAASESRKISALTEQVIKTTGGAAKITAGQVADLAEALAKKTGVDDEVIQSGSNLILTFKNIRNEVGKGNNIFDQTVSLANDMSVALGQDMKSSSIQLGKALNDPIKGVTALTRVGVSFTQQQKDQIKALTESGDLLGAQKVILAEVGDQFGGAAAAAATPFDRLKVTLGNVQEQIGGALLPVADRLATWLSDKLPTALGFAGRAFAFVKDLVAPVIEVFREFFYTLTSGFTQDEGTPIERFALRVRDVFGKLVDWFGNAVATFREFWYSLTTGFTQDEGTPIELFALRLRAVFGGVFEFLKTNIPPLVSVLRDGLGTAFDWLSGTAIPAVRDAFGSLVAGLQGKGGAGSLFTDLGNAARATAAWFISDVMPAFRGVVDFVKAHLKPILIILGVAFVALTGPIILLVGTFVFCYQKFEWFRDAVAVVMKVITTYFKFYFGLWVAIWKAVVAVFEAAWPVIRWVFERIVAAIKTAWTQFEPVFKAIVWFVGDILIPQIVDLHVKAKDTFDKVVGHVKSGWARIEPYFKTVVWFVQDKLIPAFARIAGAVGAAFDKVPGLIGAALRLAGGLVAGFLNGAAGIADAIGLDAVADTLRNAAASAGRWGSTVQASPNVTGRAPGGGGMLFQAAGGMIPGPNVNRDIVPAMLTPGEFVMTRDAVAKFGPQFMAALNAGRLPGFAAGGFVPNPWDIAKGLADGVADTARGLGAKALDLLPKIPEAAGLLGVGGRVGNNVRQAVIDWVKGKEAESGNLSGAGFTRSGGGGPAGNYTPGMLRARGDVLGRFGPMVVGGYANRNIAGTGQKSAHALWRAWDFMVRLGNVAKGNQLANFLIGNAGSYGLKGLIWNRQKNFGSGWGPYRHPGGFTDPTSAHMDHVHAEFFRKGGLVNAANFDRGGVLPPGLSLLNNTTGGPEALVPPGVGMYIENVNINDREDVDEFWRRTEFHFASAGL